MQRLKRLRDLVSPWDGLEKEFNESLEMAEMLEADDPEGVAGDSLQLKAVAEEALKRLETLELKLMLNGPTDGNNAYVHIHAGAGGTESCDWAAMLLRMYLRWCERSGFEMEELERADGDEAGIKGVTLHIKGEYAYGYLKAEIGIHRLVRISPFDGNARRQTSFASVFVDPELDDSIEITIEEKDIRIDTYRSSGAGGQHVNKTSSAIRITHKNKATAMKMLQARLYQLEEETRQKAAAVVEATKKDIGWGSQIRSYVLHPYNLVKDLRTDHETSNTQAVLDGDLDPFIIEYLKQTMGSRVVK
jgi:peptide chain release factor 2